MKIRLILKADMKKLFETKKGLVTGTGASRTVGTPEVPHAEIILFKTTLIQCEQLTLSKNFLQYLETILFSLKVLRMDV